MRVDGVEQAERDGPERIRRRGLVTDDVQRRRDDVLGGRGEDLVLVGQVPVDGPGPRRQPRGERPEGQPALPLGVEELDRRLDDALARQRLGPPLRSNRLACHERILTDVEQRSIFR